jgi:hypothetical protein
LKRVVVSVVALTLSLQSAPVGADAGHRRPKITVMKWKEPPVTTTSGECNDQGVCDEEILIVKAHDPNSSVIEVQVWFDENGARAPFVYAHTYCVQGRTPGTPARLEIGVAYAEPGEYTVAAVAYSHKRCRAHKKGDGHPYLHSRVKQLETTVEEAPQ